MRVDVRLSGSDVECELLQLDEKFSASQQPLHSMPAFPSALAGLALRYRECHGEFYLYVQDATTQRLAGYTVFNHVAGLNVRDGLNMRSPHSRYSAAYQRRGIATAVYQWALNAGISLVSGPRQSVGAHALWRSLATRYEHGYVELRDRKLRSLGPSVERELLEDFHTRMVLIGAGWTTSRLFADIEAREQEGAAVA